VVFDSIRPFYTKVDRLIVWEVGVIAFIDAGDIDVFGYTGDSND